MNTIVQEQDKIYLSEIFNEEQAAMEFQNKLKVKPHFDKICFNNVSIKVMREVTLNNKIGSETVWRTGDHAYWFELQLERNHGHAQTGLLW